MFAPIISKEQMVVLAMGFVEVDLERHSRITEYRWLLTRTKRKYRPWIFIIVIIIYIYWTVFFRITGSLIGLSVVKIIGQAITG